MIYVSPYTVSFVTGIAALFFKLQEDGQAFTWSWPFFFNFRFDFECVLGNEFFFTILCWLVWHLALMHGTNANLLICFLLFYVIGWMDKIGSHVIRVIGLQSCFQSIFLACICTNFNVHLFIIAKHRETILHYNINRILIIFNFFKETANILIDI